VNVTRTIENQPISQQEDKTGPNDAPLYELQVS
jgi:hypothetical protein